MFFLISFITKNRVSQMLEPCRGTPLLTERIREKALPTPTVIIDLERNCIKGLGDGRSNHASSAGDI